MHFMVKLGFTAAIFLLASCSSDLPDIPKYEFCRFEIAGKPFCKNFFEVDKEFCDENNGEIVTECDGDSPEPPAQLEFCKVEMGGGQVICTINGDSCEKLEGTPVSSCN